MLLNLQNFLLSVPCNYSQLKNEKMPRRGGTRHVMRQVAHLSGGDLNAQIAHLLKGAKAKTLVQNLLQKVNLPHACESTGLVHAQAAAEQVSEICKDSTSYEESKQKLNTLLKHNNELKEHLEREKIALQAERMSFVRLQKDHECKVREVNMEHATWTAEHKRIQGLDEERRALQLVQTTSFALQQTLEKREACLVAERAVMERTLQDHENAVKEFHKKQMDLHLERTKMTEERKQLDILRQQLMLDRAAMTADQTSASLKLHDDRCLVQKMKRETEQKLLVTMRLQKSLTEQKAKLSHQHVQWDMKRIETEDELTRRRTDLDGKAKYLEQQHAVLETMFSGIKKEGEAEIQIEGH